MSFVTKIRRITDQLSYNLAYAPDYPSEDKTALDREEQQLKSWLIEVIREAERSEDVIGWLNLGQSAIEAAFEKHRQRDDSGACKAFESAIEYLRNAAARKPHKVDFVVKFDGKVERSPE